MNPRVLRELRQFKKTSQLKSWDTYRALLGRLCQVHASFEFTNVILGHLRNQNVSGLVEYADFLSEQQYSDATQHFVANQFASLIKKYPFPVDLSPYDAKKAAKEKWLAAENRCSQTNQSFLGPMLDIEHQLHRMRGFISYVIGVSPELPKILRECNFGPGASIGVSGNATNVARKLASHWTVSPKALNFAYGAVSHNWQVFEILLDHNADGVACVCPETAYHRFRDSVTCIQYNKIAFVPKTVKVERPIAVEPLWNGFVQKGVDIYMRDKLARVGIDLTDQTLNQRLAREGSVDDSDEGFVTIDLSSASDSIAIEVVRNLIPHDWFYLLDSIRSQNYMDESGNISPYHKFCSMGNGFCFPLETLIFAAACSACDAGIPGKDFIVYGDDIIVRKRYAEAVLSLLGRLGFVTNANKTFLRGPFRESCGSDWFGGEDVRPFTLDFRFDCIESFFKFLNLSERNVRSTTFFAGVREFIVSLIPPVLRFCRSRDGNVDTGYRVGQDEFLASPYTKWHKNHQCWSWLELVSTAVQDEWQSLRNANYSHVYSALSGASSASPFTVRRKTRTNVRRVAYG